jgi:hypothetical protein
MTIFIPHICARVKGEAPYLLVPDSLVCQVAIASGSRPGGIRRKSSVSHWPRARPTATMSQVTVGVVTLMSRVQRAAPTRRPPANIAPRKPTAVPRTRVGKLSAW